MNYIEAQTIGEAWKQAYITVAEKGHSVKDGSVNLQELLDVFIVVKDVDDEDPILNEFADKELIKWMVEDNFGGNEPVLNWGYSYGMRFRDFRGVDQIKKIIEKLKRNPESKSATIGLMDPTTDYEGHMPCIVALDFKLRNSELHITGYFRSQDIGKKVYADFLALRKIQTEIAYSVGASLGDVKILISSAHIYEQDFGKFSI